MAHFEIEPKTLSVRVYGEDPDDYVAHFTYAKEADTATINGLVGKGFYALVLPMIGEIMEKAEVTYVVATVLEWHAVLIERKLKDVMRVERVRPVENAGRPMIWVRLSKL